MFAHLLNFSGVQATSQCLRDADVQQFAKAERFADALLEHVAKDRQRFTELPLVVTAT
jgi:hypothetical protein